MDQVNAVVEEKPVVVEPEVAERQATDAYIEQRKAGAEVVEPVVTEPAKALTPEPVLETVKEPEAVEREAVDRYLEERKEGRKRKARGGEQARIDELTKKAADLEREKAELTAKVAEAAKPAPVVEAPKPVETPKPVVVPKAQPRMNEFEDVDDYHAAMALWAADERARLAQPAPVTAEVEEPKHLKVRQEEFDRFLENGKRFIAGHPDFNETLQAAHVRGLTMSESARTAITRLAVPEVAYWLAKPENDLAARSLMRMDDLQQVVEVGRIAERLAVRPADFVSSAPAPGIRLTNGNTRSTVQIGDLDTDDYIRERRQQKRAARGR